MFGGSLRVYNVWSLLGAVLLVIVIYNLWSRGKVTTSVFGGIEDLFLNTVKALEVKPE